MCRVMSSTAANPGVARQRLIPLDEQQLNKFHRNKSHHRTRNMTDLVMKNDMNFI